MKKEFIKYFCSCCGKKLDRENDKYITSFETRFMAKWYDMDNVIENHNELDRSGDWKRGYRNILPENNDVFYEDNNHSIEKDSSSIESYCIEADMICKSCANQIVDKLVMIRDELRGMATSPKELEDDTLEKFTTEQLLEEIKKRTE